MSWRAKRAKVMLNSQTFDSQLAELDAAVAASPDAPIPLETRAHFRAETAWNGMPVAHDCQRALELRRKLGEFADADFAALAREQIECGLSAKSFGERRLARARAVAFFAMALRERADDDKLWRESARAHITLGDRAGAEADYARARKISGETPADWRAQADDFARGKNVRAAAWAHSRALALEMPEKLSGAALNQWLQTRNKAEKIDKEKLVKLELACDWAPKDAQLLLRRARLLRRLNLKEDALEDFNRALQLKPKSARIYEERAAHFAEKSYSYIAKYHAMAVADFARALELRIQSGNMADDAQVLANLGNKMNGGCYAYACFSVAMTRHGESSALFYARAQTYKVTRETIGSYPMPQFDAAFEDYLRALNCGAKGGEPFDQSLLMVAAYLAGRARRLSAHEQLEALMETRELLRGRAVADALIGAIMDATQRTIAEFQGQ